ncbi:hypothetical protein M9H77_14099 [Catharanthus roseus]|uniref:Uncharacterized protein n=1 Tax=Catharanthus roseus TaxID=4058 RepID=A0ACC0BM46_CATRO|nr:hypothetical protein M9H77_14099 [Catharanthus roseus]
MFLRMPHAPQLETVKVKYLPILMDASQKIQEEFPFHEALLVVEMSIIVIKKGITAKVVDEESISSVAPHSVILRVLRESDPSSDVIVVPINEPHITNFHNSYSKQINDDIAKNDDIGRTVAIIVGVLAGVPVVIVLLSGQRRQQQERMAGDATATEVAANRWQQAAEVPIGCCCCCWSGVEGERRGEEG